MKKSAVVTIGPPINEPWWWSEIQDDKSLCPLDYIRIQYKDKISANIKATELPVLSLRILLALIRFRGKYEYIFTFECDLATFFISFWQTLLFMRKPKHVVLQFIMREKQNTLSSRAKYALMKFIFHSCHKIICSSSLESEYYRKAFSWNEKKTAFVPMHTSKTLLQEEGSNNGHFVLAAGRSFRDYETFLKAVKGIDSDIKIVASQSSLNNMTIDENIHVLYDINIEEYKKLMAQCKILVLPLEDRKISTGQLVFLHAMAIGKPVVATRTTGTADYFEHDVNGILVEPGDADAMHKAIVNLLNDQEKCDKLASAAREQVVKKYLPSHYTENVRKALVFKK